MLFERGPLTLIAEDQFPVVGPRPRFAALLAAELAELEGAERALAAHHGVMASGADTRALEEAGLDLGSAAEEHARQSTAHDLAIGDVAAGADALEFVLTGLTGELPGDFASPPPMPAIEEGYLGLPPDVPLPPDREGPRSGRRGPGRRPPEETEEAEAPSPEDGGAAPGDGGAGAPPEAAPPPFDEGGGGGGEDDGGARQV